MIHPITFEIDNKRKLVLAQAIGDLRYKDIVDHYQQLFKDPDFFQGIGALYDFSGVPRMKGDLNYFVQIAREMADTNIVRVKSKVAIMLLKDNISMNRIFNSYSQMMDYTLMHAKVFHDRDDALDWLTDINQD